MDVGIFQMSCAASQMVVLGGILKAVKGLSEGDVRLQSREVWVM